jgi:hypothetical protein
VTDHNRVLRTNIPSFHQKTRSVAAVYESSKCLFAAMSLPRRRLYSATDAFLHDEDLLARWIEAETNKVPGASTPSQEAFRRRCEWRNAQVNLNLFDTNRSFSLEMQNKGWAARHTNTGKRASSLTLAARASALTSSAT